MKQIRITLNEIMAMAVLDVFPGTLLGESKVTSTQFSYQFRFLQPIHPEFLPLVEEKMRAILKSEPVIECIEMGTTSAENYFEHHEQPYKADQAAENRENIIPLIRIGAFYDLLSGVPCLKLPPLAFKLLEVKEINEWTQIVGTAFESKEELKAFIKLRKRWLKEKPWQAAEKMQLMTSIKGELVLLPRGLEELRRLEQIWRLHIQKQGITEVYTGKRNLLLDLAREMGRGLAEWGMPEDLVLIPASQCISSLQFIRQTISMLELKANWVVGTRYSGGVHKKQWEQEVNGLIEALEECGFSYSIDPDGARTLRPSVELRILDSLGEEAPGPFLSYEGKGSGGGFLIYSLFGPIIRLIALVAELKERVKEFES